MTKWFYKFTLVAGLSLVACAGGLGKGCASEALPNGFPLDQTIANAGGLRVTRSGLSFMESIMPKLLAKQLNAKPDGTLDFPIATSTSAPFSVLGMNFTPTICPDGPTADKCTAVMDIAKSTTQLDAQSPHTFSLRPTLPLVLQDTPVKLDYTLFGAQSIYLHVAYGDNTSCAREVPSASPHALPLRVRVPFVEGTAAPRTGYTYADVDNASIDTSGLSADNVKICADCGSLASWACNGILNSGLVKGNIVNSLKRQIESAGKNAMKSALCTTPQVAASGAPSCPAGSEPNAEKTRCVYSGTPDKCVPRQLGLDGRANLGTLLASVSPGTTGSLDYLFAAGGTMDPWPMAATPSDDERTPNGLTFHIMAGAIESEKSRCVEPVALTRPAGIPVPDELKANQLAAWPLPEGPHAGFALSERFLNFALGSAYNSGVLCMKLSADTIPQLNTGTLAVLANSIKTLPTQGQSAAVALFTHPGAPPTAAIGTGSDVNTDPLLRISMKRFGIDVMVWSHDRYVRAFTYTADISIPINLDVDATKPTEAVLLPKIGTVSLDNAVVTNSDMLLEKPDAIAQGLTNVVSGLVSSAAANAAQSLPLNGALASYGVGFAMPRGAVRQLTKDSDKFLALFANFTDTSTAPVTTLNTGGGWLSLPRFGCATAFDPSRGNTDTSVLSVAFLLMGAMWLARRNSRGTRALKWTALGLAASLPGCDCNDKQADAPPPKCGDDCSQVCEGTVDRGLVGAYGSAALGKDGKVYITGYADALFPSSGSGIQAYGDLAVGILDANGGITQWDVIDGLPARSAGTCSPLDPRGWRKGETDPGDNVGQWTSTVVAEDGTQHVTYYDVTHGTLKYALHEPGQAWKMHTIAEGAGVDAGRYASLVLQDAKPVVAFNRLTIGANATSKSAVVLAQANVARPGAASDWTMQTVAEAPDAATSLTKSPTETMPKRFGIYTRAFVSSSTIAVAAFDATTGKLNMYRRNGASWTPTQVDGPGIPGGAVSAGAGLSGAFDSAGALHVAYVDTARGALRYAKVGGNPETVDDGTSPTATPFGDRLHELSPDTALRVDSSGVVHIAYQDGTAGTLRFAVRQGATWTRTIAADPGKIVGSFPSFLSDGRLVSFSRTLDRTANEATGDLRIQNAP